MLCKETVGPYERQSSLLLQNAVLYIYIYIYVCVLVCVCTYPGHRKVKVTHKFPTQT